VVINEDDCKFWKVTVLLISLTVASTSAAEVEDVHVRFAPGGGVSSFLAVGYNDGNAKATTIAADLNGDFDIDGNVLVGYNGGTATDTYIAVADDVTGDVYVGVAGGEATKTDIAVADSVVGNLFVGVDSDGKATNTNIAAGSVGQAYVGLQGTAFNTTITLENGGGTVNAYDGATNTNIINNGDVTVSIVVYDGATNTNIINNGDVTVTIVVYDATKTTCNGGPIGTGTCVCPQSPNTCL
jgi:hypothetical protein